MWPILFEPPTLPFVVETYPVLLGLAVISGFVLALVLTRRHTTIPLGRAATAVAMLTLAGLTGGRLHFYIANRALLGPSVLTASVWSGGFHAGGAVAGVVIMSLLVTRILRVPLGAFADCLAPPAALAMAIHRVACLLRGCCLGTRCTYPWCLPYPRRSFAFLLHVHTGAIPSTALHSAPVHPLPLYYVGLCLLVLAVGLWGQRHRRYAGEVALLSLFIFSAGTWYLERFRVLTPQTVFVGDWPQLMLVGALLTLCSGLALAYAEIRAPGRRRVPAGAKAAGAVPR